ncbi:MAG: DUF4058 family protein [Cyanobacteriota bacterium]|nr:DUF4058 family protein [Cyanobacteriota bacterium]
MEIRVTAQNILVTCIEVLYPVNKRETGLTNYRQKRRRLYQAGVHLLEIDLLCRGTRPFSHPQMPDFAYQNNMGVKPHLLRRNIFGAGLKSPTSPPGRG